MGPLTGKGKHLMVCSPASCRSLEGVAPGGRTEGVALRGKRVWIHLALGELR